MPYSRQVLGIVLGTPLKTENADHCWSAFLLTMAEAYRSRTCLRHHCRTLVLKTKRHTGDETLPCNE